MNAALLSTARSRSLARWAMRLHIGACAIGIGVVATGYVSTALLRGLVHLVGFLIFISASIVFGATIRRIEMSHDDDPTPMWWRSLASCAAVAVSFLLMLGLKAGAAPTLVALGAVALIISALRRPTAVANDA
jgi:hypothetical protein